LSLLAGQVPLQADGYTCTTDDLSDVLLGVAAYVMLNHLRVTLVVRFVLPGEDTVQVLEDALKRAKSLNQSLRSWRLCSCC
jgi:hypothetical protein